MSDKHFESLSRKGFPIMSGITSDKQPSGVGTMSSDLPGAKNYFQWIISELKPHIGTNILDIGSGYGIHLEYVLDSYSNITAIDLSLGCVEALSRKFGSCSNFEVAQGDFEKEGDLEWLNNRSFDTIICLNVLEHLRDDISALRRMKEILREQEGVVLLMVPAHRWLYGSMDIQAGHFRRYNSLSLSRKLRLAGFNILRLFYFNTFGVLPWLINNRIFRKELNGSGVGLQIKIFDSFVVPMAKRIERRIKFPIGQSIIAVAKVKSD